MQKKSLYFFIRPTKQCQIFFLQYAFKNQIGQWNNTEAEEKENGEEGDTKKLEVFTTGYSKVVTQSIPNRAR